MKAWRVKYLMREKTIEKELKGSRLIIRRLKALKPTDKILFFILFYKAQARIFIYQGTSSKIPWFKAQATWFTDHGQAPPISFGRLTALGFLQVNNLTATGSRLFKY